MKARLVPYPSKRWRPDGGPTAEETASKKLDKILRYECVDCNRKAKVKPKSPLEVAYPNLPRRYYRKCGRCLALDRKRNTKKRDHLVRELGGKKITRSMTQAQAAARRRLGLRV